jgi:hypothetical protein
VGRGNPPMTPDKEEKAMGKPHGFFIGGFVMSGILKTLKNEFDPCNPFSWVRGVLDFSNFQEFNEIKKR